MAVLGCSVALVWSCMEVLGIVGQNAWILSRTPQLPSPYNFNDLVAKFTALGADVASSFSETAQPTNCVYDSN